jgi:uncharacterized integral membrane protein
MGLGRLVFWILAAIIGLVFIVFAIHNFQGVTVNLWPAPWQITLPVFLLVFVAIFLGLLAGALVAWAALGPTRRKAREDRRAVSRLSNELTETRKSLPAPGQAPSH